MKRILTLDGGGIRGMISLQILKRIETIFREIRNRPDLVLADEFNFFAGTSTGSLIATTLSLGMCVSDIEELYLQHGAEIFSSEPWYHRWKSKYKAESIGRFFRIYLSEDGYGHKPELLGSNRLRALLMIIMRNASTGSPWPVTNNPMAKYNQRELPDCNLNIPLWQLLRASTAAPTYFPPQAINIGGRVDLFVDGGVTPYNNPALIATLTAILPSFNICWPTGVDRLQVISVGTGAVRTRFSGKIATRIHMLDQLSHFIPAIMGSIAENQDLVCRVLGECVYGDKLDSEIGNLMEDASGGKGKLFTYARYNLRFDDLESMKITASQNKLDNLKLMPTLKEIGEKYAQEHVKPEHLHIHPEVS